MHVTQERTVPGPTPRLHLAWPAGLIYAAVIALGLASEAGIRVALLVQGDAVSTVANIGSHAALWRLSVLLDAGMAVADTALAVLLFWLLSPAGPVLAGVATALRLVQAAVIGASLIFQAAAVSVFSAPGLAPELAAALAFQAVGLHALGYDLGLIFFGANALLTGALLIRSPAFPDWLGWLIAAAGPVYLTGSALRIMTPDASAAFAPAYLIAVAAELAFAATLLARGYRFRHAPAPASAG